MNGRLWMQDREDASQVRRSLFQYVQPFAPHRTIVSRASGDIAAGMRETGNESGADRITDTEEYNRHIPRYRLENGERGISSGNRPVVW